jgi:hypothetical protein
MRDTPTKAITKQRLVTRKSEDLALERSISPEAHAAAGRIANALGPGWSYFVRNYSLAMAAFRHDDERIYIVELLPNHHARVSGYVPGIAMLFWPSKAVNLAAPDDLVAEALRDLFESHAEDLAAVAQ